MARGRAAHSFRRIPVAVVALIVLAGCAGGGSSAKDVEGGSARADGNGLDGRQAAQGEAPRAAPTQDRAGGEPLTGSPHDMMVVPYAEAEFVPVQPDLPNSPEIAVLRGDPATGPSAMLMRLRRGSIPMHVHSSAYDLVVLEGTMKHWDPETTEATAPPLGPGSYWFQPGELPHAEACLTETCLLQLVWAGPQDARLVP